MKFLVCCVLPDKKLYGKCLYWLNWNIFHLALKNSFPWNFPLYLIYYLPFRIFEQLALPLKTELPWNFSLHWNIFYHSGFEQLEFALNSLYCIYNVYRRIFEQLALAWKTRVALNFHGIEIYVIIQDLSNFALCPENRVCPEIFQDVSSEPRTGWQDTGLAATAYVNTCQSSWNLQVVRLANLSSAADDWE